MHPIRKFIFLTPFKVRDTQYDESQLSELVHKGFPDAEVVVLFENAREINVSRFNPVEAQRKIFLRLSEIGYDNVNDVIAIAGDIPIFMYLGAALRLQYGRFRVGVYKRTSDSYWITTV